MATKKLAQNSHNLYCLKCDYYTSRLNDYNKHIVTRKHLYGKEATNEATDNNQILAQKKTFICNCGKIYLDRTGLWRHKKKCNINNNNNIEDDKIPKKKLDDYINEALKDIIKDFIHNKDDKQHELMTQIIQNQSELQSVIKDIVKSGIITNSHNSNYSHNNNSNNKTFNLHMYLNETCKDAMNLSEFVSSIVPTIEELEKTAREGYVRGVTNIVNTRLDEVDKHIQPIHCTDGKREVLYIKENDVWNKEEGTEKPLLLKAIKSVATKNICNISEWIKLYPDCTQSDSRKNDLYLKIMLNAMAGGSEEECKINYEKIISAIAKHTVIEKNLIS